MHSNSLRIVLVSHGSLMWLITEDYISAGNQFGHRRLRVARPTQSTHGTVSVSNNTS